MTLSARLNLTIGLTMLLIIGAGFLFAIHSARRSVAEEVTSTVNLAIQLIEAAGADHADLNREDRAWLNQLRRLDRTRHLRIHIDQAATIADEAQPVPGSDAPTVPGWFTWAVTPASSVVERRVSIGTGGETTIRIAANARDEISEAWNETEGFLALLLVMAIAIYLVVHVTVGRAFRSVGVILQGLEDIDKGDYGRRLPNLSLPEFAVISRAFNHMATTLESAREENRALTQQSLRIQEEERRFLAQELHDELGQSVTAIKVMAATLRIAGEPHREAVTQIIAICDRLFAVLRSMMRRLRPTVLDELGLSASIEDLVETWRDRHPELAVQYDCDPGVDECAGEARIHLFRIVQECLTNIVRHSGAQRVRIHLSALPVVGQARQISLTIIDDGRGFAPDQGRRGFGLIGIRERVASLGGQYEMKTGEGAGVALRVVVPCPGVGS